MWKTDGFCLVGGLVCLCGRSCIQIPKVIWEHTNNRVLCMEFEEGCCATEVKELERMVGRVPLTP